MRYGVIADIHGNEEALAAVLEELGRQGVDRIICLGDIVGYNAGSNECARIIRDRGIASIMGNHELMVLGRLGFDNCADKVAFAVRRTRQIIADDVRAFLDRLPAHRVLEDSVLAVHASLRDPEPYLRGVELISREARATALALPRIRLCLFGHTHEQVVVAIGGVGAQRIPAAPSLALDAQRRTYINPGSVDGARRRDPVAQFGVLDTDRWTMSLLTVPYDHHRSEAKARRGGYRRLGERIENALRRFRDTASRG